MRRFVIGASLAAVILALLPAASAASSAVASTPVTLLTDGTVFAVAAAGDRIYAGGDFTLIGAPTGSWVAVGPDAMPLAGRPPVAGVVTAAVPDGRGGWFLAGKIAGVGSTTGSAKVIHLRASGQLDRSWRVAIAGGSVLSLARRGNTLFIGGTFKTVAGERRTALAAVSTARGRLLPWRVRGGVRSTGKRRTTPGRITKLAIGGSTLYLSGYFDLLGGARRPGLGAVAIGSRRVTRWNPAANGDVNAIRPHGRTVYIGGNFSRIGGAARNAVAAVDSFTGKSRSFNAHAPADTTVFDLVVGQSWVYIAGPFESLGGKSRHLVAALDARTGAVTPWEPVVDGSYVNRLALDAARNSLYISGALSEVGGQRRDVLAALDARTAAVTSWDPRSLGNVYVISAQSGGRVFVGGNIAFVGGSRRNGLASITSDGAVTDWDPTLEGIVRALALDSGGARLYVGGAFAPADAPAQRNLGVVDTSTGELHAFGGGTNSGVWTIAPSVDGSTLYIGGAFVTVAGKRRTRLAALDPATGALLPWNSGANDLVRVMRPAEDALYVGGDFASAGGSTRSRLVKLDIETGAALGWNPAPNESVWALELRNQELFVGGSFGQIGGRARNRLGAVDLESGTATSWDPNADEVVRSLLLSPDRTRLYAGGAFEQVGSARRGYAEFAMPAGTLTSWSPASAFDAHAMTFSPAGSLVIGGAGGLDIFP